MKANTETSNEHQIVKSAWRDQAVWSEVANILKADLNKWRYRSKVAGVLGAFLETLSASLTVLGDDFGWLRAIIALVGAIVLAAIPYITKVKTSKERVVAWVRARSASEALKESIYRYLVSALPFEPTSSPSDLGKRCRKVKEKVRDISMHAATIDPPRKDRPVALTIDEYVEMRLNGQIEQYYRPKGREKALAANRCRKWEFRLGLLAVTMGAVASAAAATGLPQLSVIGPWVAVVTTAGAAVTAHLAASRYDHEAITYFGTADRLTFLRDEWFVDSDRLNRTIVNKLVDDCENAISTENESWLAEWSREREED